MILLAKYGRDKCHLCGSPAHGINEYEVGGCWHGPSETLTIMPVCRACEHQKPSGVKGGWCGGSGGPGTPSERAAEVKKQIDRMFGEDAKPKQLVMF